MLFALKRYVPDIFERFRQVIQDQPDSGNRNECLASRLFNAAKALNISPPQQPSNPPCQSQGRSLLCWTMRCVYTRVAELLLELKGVVDSDYDLYTSLNLAADAGALHIVKFLLLQECGNIDRPDVKASSHFIWPFLVIILRLSSYFSAMAEALIHSTIILNSAIVSP